MIIDAKRRSRLGQHAVAKGLLGIFRAVRGAKIYEGTNDIQRLVISRSLVS
jgi:alkylation response protein AidB-like acyl-CoA dehydrogenase